MAKIQKKVFLTFPAKLVREPIIFNIGKNFDLIVNIRGASVSDEIGLVALMLEGEDTEIEKALQYLKDKDVIIEPIEEE
ncbi:MAG: NIL domain-containing protein [Planctomycetes bacterium]|nr:NIL domain-containing protein [Planctomycetota bacterium]